MNQIRTTIAAALLAVGLVLGLTVGSASTASAVGEAPVIKQLNVEVGQPRAGTYGSECNRAGWVRIDYNEGVSSWTIAGETIEVQAPYTLRYFPHGLSGNAVAKVRTGYMVADGVETTVPVTVRPCSRFDSEADPQALLDLLFADLAQREAQVEQQRQVIADQQQTIERQQALIRKLRNG